MLENTIWEFVRINQPLWTSKPCANRHSGTGRKGMFDPLTQQIADYSNQLNEAASKGR